MIMAEWLFVETLDELRHRCQNPDKRSRYELLGIAPLLRKLLIDNAPLLNTVRRVRSEIPLEFRIRPWHARDRFEDQGITRYLGLGNEELVGGDETAPITKLGKFIKIVVGIAQGERLTVHSVIRYYANVEGGVHFGVPKDAGEATLSRIAPMLLGHTTGQIEILAYLGQIVVNALEPLRRSILTNPTIHKRLHVKDDKGFYIGHWTTEYYKAED